MLNESIVNAIDAQDPLQSIMLPHLTNHELVSLSHTCRFFREFTSEERQQRAFEKLIKLAASGKMFEIFYEVQRLVNANPKLLLQAGNVTTRGGTEIIGTTLYEFFLGSGYPEAAELIAPYFTKIIDKDGKSIGEAERIRQYERYRPYIEQLRQEVNAYKKAYEDAGNSAYKSIYKPAYDLRSLIDCIINSSQEDITAELKQTEGYNSELREWMCAFREAINESQRNRTEGMHYAHYTTIMQVLDLLHEKWDELSSNVPPDTRSRKRLVFSQIFGYLQLVGLPARERFVFARAFEDKELSSECRYYQYPERKFFPNFDFSNLVCTGLGFLFGIIGCHAQVSGGRAEWVRLFKAHVEQKLEALESYVHAVADRDNSVQMRTS